MDEGKGKGVSSGDEGLVAGGSEEVVDYGVGGGQEGEDTVDSGCDKHRGGVKIQKSLACQQLAEVIRVLDFIAVHKLPLQGDEDARKFTIQQNY